MTDETHNPPQPDTDEPTPGPEPSPPPESAEEIPDWLKRIRERRAAEASGKPDVSAEFGALTPDAGDNLQESPPDFDPDIFEHVPQPDTLPGWLRVAAEDPEAVDQVPPAADADAPETPATTAAPIAWSSALSEPVPAPPMEPEPVPAPPQAPPQPTEPVIDPSAEAPDWLKAAVAAKAADSVQEVASSPSPAGVPVRAAPETTASAEDTADDTAAREAIRAARARRRRERRAQARRSSPLTNTIQSLVVTVVAAAMIATIFTFWTPANFLSDETREGLRPAYATLSAQSPPTPIPTPVWMRQIGIVSGHWGPYPGTGRDDPGAVCPDGLTEAEINRSVAQLVVQQLSGRGYDVDLLDEWDPRLDNYQASALLSIHSDSCFEFDQPGATGFKVAPPASRTSARTDDLRLQDCLVRNYGEITGLPLHPSLTRDMTEYHSFREISPVTPANIIELGFMFEDRDILENRPDLMAEGIVTGILCFLENAPPTPLPELTPWPTLEATPTPLATPGVS